LPLSSVEIPSAPHLGGNILEGDLNTYTPQAWNYVLERFAVSSVLDVGSGIGYAAHYFFNKGCKVVAIDGLIDNCRQAVYPTACIDLTQTALICPVDLVHCQEVVEHIEEKYIDNLLATLANGKFILMTHATPGQGGYHHVNEQTSEYWVQHMARYNCHVLGEDTNRIRRFAGADNAVYMARSGLLFANRARFNFPAP
jgi:SAM-dependent methyltransferase